MIISEFIEEIVKKYNIDLTSQTNFKQNLKMKISRIIKNDKSLATEYNNATTIKIARTSAKSLSSDFFEKLEQKLLPYLLKSKKTTQKITQNEYLASNKLAKLKYSDPEYYNLLTKITTPNIKNKNLIQINHRHKVDLMIQALFYEKYEFEEEQYALDLHFIKLFNNNKLDIDKDINIITEALTRIRNPLKFYIHKKK